MAAIDEDAHRDGRGAGGLNSLRAKGAASSFEARGAQNVRRRLKSILMACNATRTTSGSIERLGAFCRGCEDISELSAHVGASLGDEF